MENIRSDDDSIFSMKDRIFFVQARTVYFPVRPFIFKDHIFYFSGPYILPYNTLFHLSEKKYQNSKILSKNLNKSFFRFKV